MRFPRSHISAVFHNAILHNLLHGYEAIVRQYFSLHFNRDINIDRYPFHTSLYLIVLNIFALNKHCHDKKI